MHNQISDSVRSSMASQDSDQFLSYYGSEDAGQTYVSTDKLPPPISHRREPSTESLSSSDCSLDSNSDRGFADSELKPTKNLSGRSGRSGARSEEGRDRRQLPFGQIDTAVGDKPRFRHHTHDTANEGPSSNTLRSRRGLEDRVGDLKLASPSDTLQKPYPYLTPPSTAPVFVESSTYNSEAPRSSLGGHSRSQSEVADAKSQGTHHQRKSSRDVGIVGAVRRASQRKHDANETLIFQQPHNHSLTPKEYPPDPAKSPHRATTAASKELQLSISLVSGRQADTRATATTRPMTTSDTQPPAVMQKRAVQQTSSPPFSPATSPYQPDTDGPLPPKTIYTILSNTPVPPRPPRLQSPPPARRRGDMEAVVQPLQLHNSTTPVLPPKPSDATTENDTTESPSSDAVDKKETSLSTSTGTTNDAEKPPPTSFHLREGAFPPSIIVPSESETPQSASNPTPRQMNNDVDITISAASPTTTSQPPSLELPSLPQITLLSIGLESQPNESWIRISPLPSREPTPPSEPNGRVSEEIPRTSLTRSRDGHTPSPPPKSPRGFRASLVRRFSTLPRTPSSRGSSAGPKTPSPSGTPARVLPPVQKMKSYWPPAMQCSDVLAKRTALERCVGYAQKINSLYIYDCGLSDWLMEVKSRGPNSHRAVTQTTASSTLSPIAPQPRQISGASMVSEVTFPRRADATPAIDLKVKPDNVNVNVVPTSPPPLPYPSLVQSQVSSPTRSSSVLGSSSSKRMLATPGNFFASLGRKASVRKDKSSLNSASATPGKQFGNSLPSTPNPRPINITTAPSVPGGPRAPPNRAQRSKTIMVSSRAGRHSTLTRRPSLFDLSSSERPPQVQVDPDFAHQVDKLADLLPHADRVVLAGYLRRSGQDILAIGQYLEDEKNGTIRRD